MPNRAGDVDVLIVGAGPVGLLLANECARRGLRFRLVEARASQSEHSKALAIFPRTLEIFDMAGLAGPFLGAANRVTSVRDGSQMENGVVFDCGVKSGVIAKGSFRAHLAWLHITLQNEINVRRHLEIDGFAADQLD